MSATQQESDAYYALDESNLRTLPSPIHSDSRLTFARIAAPAPNFISEVFFLTCTYLHIGPMHTIREHKDLSTAIGQLKRALKNLELDNSFAGVRPSLPSSFALSSLPQSLFGATPTPSTLN